MNKEVKDQWVTALRSGEYEQGRSQLQTSDGKFCCLGVLCEVAVKAGVLKPPVKDEHGNVHYGPEDDTNTAYPPKVVLDWANLDQSPNVPFKHPDWNDGTYHSKAPLTAINDAEKADFNGIADLIEEHL